MQTTGFAARTNVAVLVEVRIQSFLAFTSKGLTVNSFKPYSVYSRGKIASQNTTTDEVG